MIGRQFRSDPLPKDAYNQVECGCRLDLFLEAGSRLIEFSLPALDDNVNVGGINPADPAHGALRSLPLGFNVARRGEENAERWFVVRGSHYGTQNGCESSAGVDNRLIGNASGLQPREMSRSVMLGMSKLA